MSDPRVTIFLDLCYIEKKGIISDLDFIMYGAIVKADSPTYNVHNRPVCSDENVTTKDRASQRSSVSPKTRNVCRVCSSKLYMGLTWDCQGITSCRYHKHFYRIFVSFFSSSTCTFIPLTYSTEGLVVSKDLRCIIAAQP